MIDEQTKEVLEVVIEANLSVASKKLGEVYSRIRRRFAFRKERVELIRNLFLDQGEFLFHPSSDYVAANSQITPPHPQIGYPHDVAALLSFDPFLPGETKIQKSLLFDGSLTPTSRVICAGSPKANKLSRKYLPSIAVQRDGNRVSQYQTCISEDRLTYVFGEDFYAPTVDVVSMMYGGKRVPKTRKIIWHRKGKNLLLWSPLGYELGGKLNADFLLVSRLPRTKTGGDILVFAGGHGSGTQAISLLLNQLPPSQLKDITDIVGGEPYFQFVLEVSDFSHSADGTLAARVCVSEQLPPVVLDLGPNDLIPESRLKAK